MGIRLNHYSEACAASVVPAISGLSSFVLSIISETTMRRSRPNLRRESCVIAAASSGFPCFGGYAFIRKGLLDWLSINSFT